MDSASPALLACTALLSACITVDPTDAAQDPAQTWMMPPPVVLDFEGTEHPAGAIPLRPRIEIPLGALEADEDPVLLLRGAPDADLQADLMRVPLTVAQRARVVDTRIRHDPRGVRLEPRLPLDRDALYALVIAGWARRLDGTLLNAERQPALLTLRTSAAPEAGARLLATWPADGSQGVGTNLALVAVAFDGDVHGADEHLFLQGPDGAPVATSVDSPPCETLGLPGSHCVRLVPQGALVAQGAHAIVLGPALRDGLGAPVGPLFTRFQTGAGPDTERPAVVDSPCFFDEVPQAVGCVLVDDESISIRTTVDEAARARWMGPGGPAVAHSGTGDLRLRIAGLSPGERIEGSLQIVDNVGNVLDEPFSASTHRDLPRLSIVEVHADSLGPEPAQEFVELLNYGTAPIDLSGLALADDPFDPGVEIAASATIHPGGRALLVADRFDPAHPRDAAPPPGALLVRVGKALAGSGLVNSGEALYLRDRQGRRVSASAASPRPKAGACIVRSDSAMRDGSDGTFELTEVGGCTPGR